MAFVPFVESDQPTIAAFNEKFQQAIAAAIAGGKQIQKVGYVGTGTYGKNSPVVIEFETQPDLVVVGGASQYPALVFVKGSTGLILTLGGQSYEWFSSWSENNLSFYSNQAGVGSALQHNSLNVQYYALMFYA